MKIKIGFLLLMALSTLSASGDLGSVGSWGNAWSSSVSGSDAKNLSFGTSTNMNSNPRALGLSVRCVRDE